MDPPPHVKFLWLFGGSEVCLTDSATATQLCRHFHQNAHGVCRCPDACRLFRTSPAAYWCCSACSSSYLCSEILPSVVTFAFIQIFDHNFVFFTKRRKSWCICLIQRQNLRYFRCPVWRRKVDKTANLHELKHPDSILDSFEYFCQLSSKCISI